jgi:hypothetical protein
MHAGTASHPPRTRLLIARSPIPDSPAHEQLSAVAHDQEMRAAAREALTMALITVKRIARGNQWIVATHLGHVARCVARMEWLAQHGAPPAYEDLREPDLPDVTPVTARGQLTLLGSLLDRLDAALATAPDASKFAGAFAAIRAWLDRIDSIG